MLYRIKKSLDDGWGKVKWFASILSVRLNVEMAVIKLLRESANLEKTRDTLVSDIGQRIFELRRSRELNVFDDAKVAASLRELESVDEELEQLKSRVTEIGEAD